jgi:hypothetical protein
MNIPGFTADSSLDPSHVHFYTVGAGPIEYQATGVMLAADSCSCTSPTCTWSCPTTTDPCVVECAPLRGCAKYRCLCTCSGNGTIEPSPHSFCGFKCVPPS